MNKHYEWAGLRQPEKRVQKRFQAAFGVYRQPENDVIPFQAASAFLASARLASKP